MIRFGICDDELEFSDSLAMEIQSDAWLYLQNQTTTRRKINVIYNKTWADRLECAS